MSVLQRRLPIELIDIIFGYAPKYRLLDWIPKEKILRRELSSNPHDGAIQILKECTENVD
jgi:hypothetical protein